MHCYDLLTAHPKWKSSITDIIQSVQSTGKGKGKARRNSLSSSPDDSESNRDVDVDLSRDTEGSESRPFGVKNAKRKEKMKRPEDFWGAAANAHDERYFAEREERKILKAKQTAIMLEGLEVDKEKNELTKKIIEDMRREKDDAVMALDTSVLEPDQQEYYRIRRTEIMKSRRGDV